MTALAQQELLESPPTRRIIVPAGCSSWWGVDPSSVRVAIAMVRGQAPDVERDVRTAPFARLSGPARLPEIYTETYRLAREMAREAPPGLILVEQPSGSSQAVNHELEYAVGVIQAAVLAGVHDELGHWPQMETVVASWWKLRACGHGGIKKTYRPPGAPKGSKPKPLPTEDYAVLRWARLNGYTGSSWDESDAMAIAEAARRDVQLEQR